MARLAVNLYDRSGIMIHVVIRPIPGILCITFKSTCFHCYLSTEEAVYCNGLLQSSIAADLVESRQ